MYLEPTVAKPRPTTLLNFVFFFFFLLLCVLSLFAIEVLCSCFSASTWRKYKSRILIHYFFFPLFIHVLILQAKTTSSMVPIVQPDKNIHHSIYIYIYFVGGKILLIVVEIAPFGTHNALCHISDALLQLSQALCLVSPLGLH